MINPVKGDHLRLLMVKNRRNTRLLTFLQQADIRLFRFDQSFFDIPYGTTGLITQRP